MPIGTIDIPEWAQVTFPSTFDDCCCFISYFEKMPTDVETYSKKFDININQLKNVGLFDNDGNM